MLLNLFSAIPTKRATRNKRFMDIHKSGSCKPTYRWTVTTNWISESVESFPARHRKEHQIGSLIIILSANRVDIRGPHGLPRKIGVPYTARIEFLANKNPRFLLFQTVCAESNTHTHIYILETYVPWHSVPSNIRIIIIFKLLNKIKHVISLSLSEQHDGKKQTKQPTRTPLPKIK